MSRHRPRCSILSYFAAENEKNDRRQELEETFGKDEEMPEGVVQLDEEFMELRSSFADVEGEVEKKYEVR